MKWLAFLLLVAFSGCVGEDQQRSDDFFINIQAEGEFQIALPLPLDDGTSRAFWEEQLVVSLGNVSVSHREGPRPLVITGSGNANLEALSRRSYECCVALQAEWTTGEETPTTTLEIEVLAGEIELLSLHKQATSCRGDGCGQAGAPDTRVCSHIFEATLREARVGIHAMDVRTDDVRCFST